MKNEHGPCREEGKPPRCNRVHYPKQQFKISERAHLYLIELVGDVIACDRAHQSVLCRGRLHDHCLQQPLPQRRRQLRPPRKRCYGAVQRGLHFLSATLALLYFCAAALNHTCAVRRVRRMEDIKHNRSSQTQGIWAGLSPEDCHSPYKGDLPTTTPWV